jgi:hypothetical protein
VIESITQEPASTLSSYEDLWRFTLANYNGGPGCITEAIEAAWESDEVLTWENVSLNFTEGCNRVIDYVEDIAPEIENPD